MSFLRMYLEVTTYLSLHGSLTSPATQSTKYELAWLKNIDAQNKENSILYEINH